MNTRICDQSSEGTEGRVRAVSRYSTSLALRHLLHATWLLERHLDYTFQPLDRVTSSTLARLRRKRASDTRVAYRLKGGGWRRRTCVMYKSTTYVLRGFPIYLPGTPASCVILGPKLFKCFTKQRS